MSLKSTYLWVGSSLAGSWLFVALSFVVSTQTTGDWFARSGAVMCLIAAVANFALVKLHQQDLARIFKDEERSAHEKAEAILKPPEAYMRLSWLSYVTGFLGTAIWGYGDLLI